MARAKADVRLEKARLHYEEIHGDQLNSINLNIRALEEELTHLKKSSSRRKNIEEELNLLKRQREAIDSEITSLSQGLI